MMNKETASVLRFIRLSASDSDERCRQRLHEALEIHDESIEVIMNLRSQVLALRERMKELESMLEMYQSRTNTRLIRYRQVFYEAEWEES